MSSGKLILLLIAMGMVGLVLLLGYKLDKNEEKGKRKEKINKKRENKEEISYSDFKSFENDYEEMEKTSSFGAASFEFNKDVSKNNEYLEDLDKTAVIEKIDLSKLELAEEDVSYEEPEVDSNLEEFEEEIYEVNDEYDYEASSSSTMVFDTTSVNEELEVVGIVKGYDFDDEDVEETKKEEKPKTTRKTAAKKTATKKATTKKTETKPKTVRKTTTKKVEEKPKTTRKTAAKKTTTKKATTKKTETKPKTVRKTTTKKVEEKPKATRKTTTKTATTKTTKNAVKSTKTNTKK